MGRIIFYVLIIVGLCFGQGIWLKENPKITLPIPINVAIRSEEGINEIAMRKFSLYSLQTLSLISPLYPNTLIMQVEGESLQPRPSFWRQAGIYGLELIAGGVGAATCLYVPHLLIPRVPSENIGLQYTMLGVYFMSTPLLASTCAWVTGKLFKQKGHWWKAFIGAGVGTVIGFSLEAKGTKGNESCVRVLTFALLSPSLGAVIGFNF